MITDLPKDLPKNLLGDLIYTEINPFLDATINYDISDSASVFIESGKITQINSLGTVSATLVQSTEANRAALEEAGLGGGNIANFVTGNFYDTLESFTRDVFVDSNNKDFTYFNVFKQNTNTSSGSFIMEWITALEAFKLGFYNLGTRFLVQCGDTTIGRQIISVSTQLPNRDTTFYVCSVRRAVDDVEVRWYNNGLVHSIDTTLTDTLNTGNATLRVDPIGKLAQQALYNKALTDTEVSERLKYLGNKWGIVV
jgi:hypothetical protein